MQQCRQGRSCETASRMQHSLAARPRPPAPPLRCTARPAACGVAFFWRIATADRMPVVAPAFGGCLMAVPGPPSTAPQNSEMPSTAAPSTAAPKAKASPEAQREANTFEVPVRGRDVPHPQRGRSQSTAPQRASSSRGYYDAGQGVIWHQDRSGRYWPTATG